MRCKELPDYFTRGARKSFYRQQGRRQKVFEKIQGIRHLVLEKAGMKEVGKNNRVRIASKGCHP